MILSLPDEETCCRMSPSIQCWMLVMARCAGGRCKHSSKHAYNHFLSPSPSHAHNFSSHSHAYIHELNSALKINATLVFSLTHIHAHAHTCPDPSSDYYCSRARSCALNYSSSVSLHWMMLVFLSDPCASLCWQCTVKGGRETRDLDAFELAQV